MNENSENIGDKNIINQTIIFNDNKDDNEIEEEIKQNNVFVKEIVTKSENYIYESDAKKINKRPYVLLETIGEGNFGKVKKAKHIHINENLAIKIINKKKISQKNDIIRIKKEITILKKLRHKNIIQIYEVLESNNNIYIAMEYCENKDLFEYIIKNKKLTEMEACRIFRQLINGIEYIHSQNIIHRDLKPENILLDSNFDIKISDFGLSTFYNKGENLYTACGTPNYSPPEVLRGQPYDGELCDIWVCGIILYTMLIGTLPCSESNEYIILNKIINDNYIIPNYLSNDASDLLKKILNKNCNERIRINEIKKHPWFNKLNNIMTPGIDIKNNLIAPIDDIILNEIGKYGFDIEECRNYLLHMKNNPLTTVYYLLLKKNIREGKESISDLKSELFLNYIKNISNNINRVNKIQNNKNKKTIKSYMNNNNINNNNKNKPRHNKMISHDITNNGFDYKIFEKKNNIFISTKNQGSRLIKDINFNDIKEKVKNETDKLGKDFNKKIQKIEKYKKFHKKLKTDLCLQSRSPYLLNSSKYNNDNCIRTKKKENNTIYYTNKLYETKDLLLFNSYLEKHNKKNISKNQSMMRTTIEPKKNKCMKNYKKKISYNYTDENERNSNTKEIIFKTISKRLNSEFDKNIEKNNIFERPTEIKYKIFKIKTISNSNKKQYFKSKISPKIKNTLFKKNDIHFSYNKKKNNKKIIAIENSQKIEKKKNINYLKNKNDVSYIVHHEHFNSSNFLLQKKYEKQINKINKSLSSNKKSFKNISKQTKNQPTKIKLYDKLNYEQKYNKLSNLIKEDTNNCSHSGITHKRNIKRKTNKNKILLKLECRKNGLSSIINEIKITREDKNKINIKFNNLEHLKIGGKLKNTTFN